MSKDANHVKVVLVGDSGVGKTCIISRFISGTFDANSVTTTGGSFATKEVKYDSLSKVLALDIWDTAGQERFKSLTKFFYKDANIVILVYDIAVKKSFEQLKEYWYKEVKDNGDKNFVLGIAGNKCDRYEFEEVPEEEAKAFAEQVGAVFYLTSAQDNTGIADLFYEIGGKYLDPNFQNNLKQDKKTNNDNTNNKSNNAPNTSNNIKLENKKDEPKQKKKSKC